MKLVATIACRNNSNRLYGKPLQILKKKNVLHYIVDALKKRPEISDIVIAISETSGNEIYKDEAERLGVKYVFGDDKDVLGRLIKACELAGGDTVFRITSESPFPYFERLEEAVQSHLENKADYTSHSKLPDGSMFELVNLSALKKSHDDGEDRHRSELCTLYMNENKDIFKFNILDVPENHQRPTYRLTIDFPEDLILCRKIINHFGEDNYIKYDGLLEYLDSRPDERKIVEDIIGEDYIKPYH
tara:strand:+ start:34250 stop:34984 length:735 start_codon:yes stop_codon:yes gene_type:complete